MSSATIQLDLGGEQPITIQRITMERPWAWLGNGFRDLMRNPGASLGYGIFWTVISVGLSAGLWSMGQGSWLLPLVAGFMLAGPLIAVGLYQISRDAQAGRTPSLGRALVAWKANAAQIALLGVLLMIFLLAWIRFATLLFALFFGTSLPSFEVSEIYLTLLLSGPGIALVLVGTLIGAVLAFIAFAMSVVSVPHLLADPKSSVLEAIIISLAVVKHNLGPMILWAALLGAIGVAGLLPLFLGLVVVLPVLGHASWHAYEELVSHPETGE